MNYNNLEQLIFTIYEMIFTHITIMESPLFTLNIIWSLGSSFNTSFIVTPLIKIKMFNKKKKYTPQLALETQ